MKRLASIFFLGILLFNLCGYRLVFDLLQSRSESIVYDRIETTSETDLVSLKIATHLPPYATESDGYEWKDGEVDYNGITYKYVKRKIFKDSIEFLCIPHHDKMKVENAREEFFRLCHDLAAGSTKKPSGTSILKPLLLEAPLAGFLQWEQPEAADKIEERFFNDLSIFPSHTSGIEKPPQAAQV